MIMIIIAKDVEITVALKHLDNFWRIFKMPLINCKINLILANCIIDAYTDDGQVSTFAITDTKRYVPVVTLSTQDNVKLLRQLESGLKKVTWNTYQSKLTIYGTNPYLDCL